ncbi:MAG: tetratricopeptide repeat protein [Desulfovibrio sp.]|nr:tetratricopeptide repeat protein [Desulfovibrio sp.]
MGQSTSDKEQIQKLLRERQFAQAETLLLEALQNASEEDSIHFFDMLSTVYRSTNRLEKAEEANYKALANARKTCEPHSLTLASVLHNLSMTLDLEQKYAEAIPFAEEELTILRQCVPDTDKRVANCLLSLAKHHYELGRFSLAKEMINDLIERYTKLEGRKCVGVSACLNNLGRILENEGCVEQAIPLYEESVAIRKELLGTHEDTAFSLLNLGTALASQARYREAAQAFIACRDMYEELGLLESPYLQAARDNIIVCWNAVCTPC